MRLKPQKVSSDDSFRTRYRGMIRVRFHEWNDAIIITRFSLQLSCLARGHEAMKECVRMCVLGNREGEGDEERVG